MIDLRVEERGGKENNTGVIYQLRKDLLLIQHLCCTHTYPHYQLQLLYRNLPKKPHPPLCKREKDTRRNYKVERKRISTLIEDGDNER